jgi:hypothetical protein
MGRVIKKLALWTASGFDDTVIYPRKNGARILESGGLLGCVV